MVTGYFEPPEDEEARRMEDWGNWIVFFILLGMLAGMVESMIRGRCR
jgi:hypothetical protein